jgi:Sec-independent protein translocase protein TatA
MLTRGPSSPVQPIKAAGGFSWLHLLLVAVIAFLIGHVGQISVPGLTEKLRAALDRA